MFFKFLRLIPKIFVEEKFLSTDWFFDDIFLSTNKFVDENFVGEVYFFPTKIMSRKGIVFWMNIDFFEEKVSMTRVLGRSF